jgi:hypothetical protein
MFRPSHLAVGALALMAAACNDSVSNFVPAATAAVRLVNDTDTPLSLAHAGTVDSANAKLGFGTVSGCVLVDLSNTTVPALTITNGVTGASITFTPDLTIGASLMVVAFGDTLGNVQLATLNNRFVPAANDAGLRFFNGTHGVGALFMQRGGIALTPSISFGAASDFVSVPTDSASITFANGTSIVHDAGRMAFPLGQNSTVLIGPPASGTNPLRSFTAQGC